MMANTMLNLHLRLSYTNYNSKMKTKLNFTTVLILLLLLVSFILPAQNQEKATKEFTDNEKEAIIKRVAANFRKEYLFTDVSEQMVTYIENRFENGDYDSITIQKKFTAQLEKDMQLISKDKHVKIRTGEAPTDFDDLAVLRKENFGFRDVEILPGNIGFLSFYQFYDPKFAAPTAIAALNFLANCDALIIDLRSNGGGRPEMKKFICSYFFDDPVCLLEFRNSGGVISQQFSEKEVSGPKMLDIPIYILVGPQTFSGAEGFTFSMQNLGRATVIGEKTRGGAHDSRIFSSPSESIYMQIPIQEAADPVTKKTWEGVGIQPDIIVAWEDAKYAAIVEATKTLIENNDPDEYWKGIWQWVKKDNEMKLNPIQKDETQIIEYVGQYGNFKVSLENCKLYFQYKTRPKTRLVPIEYDCFNQTFQDDIFNSMQRIMFDRGDSGKIIGFHYQTSSGYVGRVHKKTL